MTVLLLLMILLIPLQLLMIFDDTLPIFYYRTPNSYYDIIVMTHVVLFEGIDIPPIDIVTPVLLPVSDNILMTLMIQRREWYYIIIVK